MPSSPISSGPSASAVRLALLGRELSRALGEPLGSQLVRRAVDEVAGAVRPGRDGCSALRGLLHAVGPAADDERRALRGRVLALPARGLVAAEERSVHDRPRLLRRRQRQRVVEQPGDPLRVRLRFVGDGRGGRAERIRSRRCRRAPTPAPATRRAPSFPSTCTSSPGRGRRAARRRSQGARAVRRDRRRARCGSGETVAAGDGNSEDICLDRLRRTGFDVDPHGGAMLSDAPPSLSPRWGLTSDALAPIGSSWLAAQPIGPCADPLPAGPQPGHRRSPRSADRRARRRAPGAARTNASRGGARAQPRPDRARSSGSSRTR